MLCVVLNVPVVGQESLVRQIGGCHGDKLDKFTVLGITRCLPGWKQWPSDDPHAIPAIYSCVAHMCCEVQRMEGAWEDEHWIIYGRIQSAYVRKVCRSLLRVPVFKAKLIIH